jgi:putative DNA topoisomerase
MYSQVHVCPACKGKLLSQTNRNGQTFWFCEKRPSCKITFCNEDDKPVLPKQIYICKCKRGILGAKKGYQGKAFWGCSQYPDCKNIYNDKLGKPKT